MKAKRVTLNQDNEDLLFAAARLEADIGQNPYSRFLREHGRRPTPDQATAIGRIMSARVRASDGRLYPTPAPAEKAARRAILERRKAWARACDVAHAARDFIATAPTHSDIPVAAIMRAWWGERPNASDIDVAIEMLRRIRDAVED